MTVTEKPESDVASVFAAAAPVQESDLVEAPEEANAPESKPRESGSTARGTSSRSVGVGRPTWHLSLTLGLLIALVGGVVLWLQSPTVALLVVGGLVILVGLALALWHLFGVTGARRRQGGTATRGTGANGGGTGSATGANRRATGSASGTRATDPRGTGSATRGTSAKESAARGTRDRAGGTPDRQRGTDRWHPRGTGGNPSGTGRPRGAPGGSTDRPTGGKQPSGGRQNGGNSGGTGGSRPLLGGDKGGKPTGDPSRPRSRFDRWNRDGYPRADVITCGPRTVRRRTKAADEALDEGKKPVKVKPLRWRTARGKLPVPKPPEPMKPPRTSSWRPKRETVSGEPEWPNVDLDQHGPVIVGKPPRITIPRRVVRLPPVYHRHRGEPSWPTDDPDRPNPVKIPPQRDRRGTVSAPDQMNRGARELHFNDAATVATAAAQAKDEEANRFLQLAGELDGVEGMEGVRDRHYQAAGASAHDAEVRRGMASIYGFLSEHG